MIYCAICSTGYGSPLALPALLTAFRKRRHVDISYVRTCGIFSSRQALLDYEEALALEGRIDEALSGQTPMVDSAPASSYRSAQRKVKAKEKEPSSNVNPRVEAAKAVREIWIEVYDRWKVLVNVTGDPERLPGLERFDCGMPVLVMVNHNSAHSRLRNRTRINKNHGDALSSMAAC